MTQKELAAAVDGLSAQNISEAERGLKELTDEQLAAIAKATGSASLSPETVKDEAPSAPPAAEAASADVKADILKLISAVDPAVKQAAASVLKGETTKSKGVLDDVLPAAVGMMESNKGGNPLLAIIGFLASEQGRTFLGTLKVMVGNITEAFGQGDAADGMDQDGRKSLDSLLVFTFAYSIAMYILLLSFYFWLIRKDIKPEHLG